MTEKRGRGFSSRQVQRLKDLGLTPRHVDALVLHALPKIRQYLRPPPSQEIKALLQNLASAGRSMQEAICAIRYPGAVELQKSQRPPTPDSEVELRQRRAEKELHAKFAVSLLASAWENAISDGSPPSSDPDVHDEDLITPLQQLDQLSGQSGSVVNLALAAMAELPKQARKTIGDPEPVLEIWRVIDRTNRNLNELRSIADRERTPLPPMGALAPPWQRGSRFSEVVEVCYEAAGHVGRPKNALLAARRSLKATRKGT